MNNFINRENLTTLINYFKMAKSQRFNQKENRVNKRKLPRESDCLINKAQKQEIKELRIQLISSDLRVKEESFRADRNHFYYNLRNRVEQKAALELQAKIIKQKLAS